jgi:hypothetical protein
MIPSTRIRPITGRHLLLPASQTRTANSVPYGFACPDIPGRKYGVSTFRVIILTDNLGAA